MTWTEKRKHPRPAKHRGAGAALVCILLMAFCALAARAQQASPNALPGPSGLSTLSTEAVEPLRFIAVHGQHSVVMGYANQGLEIWGYPFQILSNYQVSFRPSGATSATDGRLLMRRIDYRPESVTRVYIGPDYLVREKIFVPLDEAAAVISYEVEGTRSVDIEVHFQPVLDLMWPGGLGGQYTRWNQAVAGYEIAEPQHGITAVIGSTETIEHDDTVNSTVRVDSRFLMTMRPHDTSLGRATAALYVVLNPANTKEPEAGLHALAMHVGEREAQAVAHYQELENHSIRIRTPDEEVNSALAWSENALDQAWVCNPMIGCGVVAGYGPSRDARRPQYAWYFAGDGLVATNALISAGEYGRAQEELSFITRYQEPKTGMIWHELSQSAGYVDWSKYPYMYVHVDISFDYLSTVARYVAVSGDTAFARAHWSAISMAYAYCHSLINSADHLPHIPADKEGGDEQARPGDDLGLSAGWLAASAGFEDLARQTQHLDLADQAHQENQLARQAIPIHYWDAGKHFWIDGHTGGGRAIPGRRRGPTQLLEGDVFSASQRAMMLDQLASSDFQTDWGVREVAASSPDYDPYSYGRGSVTAPSTTATAMTYWKEHRPEIANEMWSAILPWNTLDSLGHIHEVLAGNFYHEQTESVPEQTWSSAGLLDSAVRGLLGLELVGSTKQIKLAPHLPAAWGRVSVDNVRLPHGTLNFVISQNAREIDLEIDNQGEAASLVFEPEVPLGSHLLGAEFEGHAVAVASETFAEDEHARILLAVPRGASHCRLHFEGGVSFIFERRSPHVGNRSTGIKLTSLSLQDRTLTVDADLHREGDASFVIRTPWRIVAQQGATNRLLEEGLFEVTLAADGSPAKADGYRHAHAVLTFNK